jgi:hypothetical protein
MDMIVVDKLNMGIVNACVADPAFFRAIEFDWCEHLLARIDKFGILWFRVDIRVDSLRISHSVEIECKIRDNHVVRIAPCRLWLDGSFDFKAKIDILTFNDRAPWNKQKSKRRD